ncbi:hypothetical protein ACFVUY_10910 [Kitasatospora sp. NPDC058063]|uniref:hypothetical protein n=1 Tax=unclassified Kitasatospora TaxID=2633591 RepID=UPI0036DF158E
MVYRIHFTAGDLARTRPADPMPLTELMAAARALQSRSHAARLDPWRRRALAGLPERARLALSLVPADGWGAYSKSKNLVHTTPGAPYGDPNADWAPVWYVKAC